MPLFVCVYMCICYLCVNLCVHTQSRLLRGWGNGCEAFWLRSALVSSQETAFGSSEVPKMTLINDRLERNTVFLPSPSFSSNLLHFFPDYFVSQRWNTQPSSQSVFCLVIFNLSIRTATSCRLHLLAGLGAGWSAYWCVYCVLLTGEHTVTVLWGDALHPSISNALQWLQHHGHWPIFTKIMLWCSQKMLDSESQSLLSWSKTHLHSIISSHIKNLYSISNNALQA